MTRTLLSGLFLLPLVLGSNPFGGSCGALAAEDSPTKWFEVEGAVNPEPGYMLRVSVNKPSCVYYEGETMTVQVVAEKDCYLYLLYYSGDKVGCLFPNKYQQDNFIPAHREVTVPQPGSNFKIVCRPPFGTEVLHAVATLEPAKFFQEKDFSLEAVTQVGQQDLRQMVTQVQKDEPANWAEARIQITTMPRGEIAKRKTRRLGVCVGISQYQNSRIQTLQVSHQDAERMATALKQECGVDDVVLLTNEQATRAAIEQAVFHDLVNKSRPGDTVFIFFSCHGGRTSDTNGDEQDGFDEYLVPQDGELGKPDTMILDDTFARWMQELDGRQVAIILDNCYSGGAAKGIKGLAGPRLPAGSAPVDFLDGELRRAKDLGQTNTMIVAACQATQLAWEMPAAGEGSVLTYHLLRSLRDSGTDDNGDGALTVGEIYRHAEQPITAYVQQTFSADQTPVLIDNAEDRILFKP